MVFEKKDAYLHLFFLTCLIVVLAVLRILVAICAGKTVRVKGSARVAVSVTFIAGVKLCHTSLRLGLQNLRRRISVTTTHIPYESKASVSHRIRIRNRSHRSHRVIVWVEAQSNQYCRNIISIFSEIN